MYTAKKDIDSYLRGKIKARAPVVFNKAWLDAGLIEEKPAEKKVLETKPQPKFKNKK